jgi:hypothetical protein
LGCDQDAVFEKEASQVLSATLRLDPESRKVAGTGGEGQLGVEEADVGRARLEPAEAFELITARCSQRHPDPGSSPVGSFKANRRTCSPPQFQELPLRYRANAAAGPGDRALMWLSLQAC